MDRDTIIARLRRDEAELRALGVASLSLFGSVARGENGPRSDVDLAVTLDRARMPAGFAYAALGVRVDMVVEPVRKRRFQEDIDRDRVLAF